MIRKLRRQFILVIMLIVALMLSLILGTAMYLTKMNYEQTGYAVMEAAAIEPFKSRAPGLHESGDNATLPYFTVTVNPWGDYMVEDNGYYDLSDTAMIEEIIDEAEESSHARGVLDDYSLRFYIRADAFSKTYVFMDISSEEASYHWFVQTCILIFAVALTVFFGISWLLSYWVIKPVDEAWKQQRQFVADASHELKTPLTVIMTNAELLESPSCSDDNKAQLANNILTMSGQMRGLVESLLELARADNGNTKTVYSRVDFSKLTAEAILPFEPMFFEDGDRVLESNIEPDICLTGSASHLRQIVEILLDNARKYSDPGTTTMLILKKQGRHCILSVADHGDTLTAQELKDIFKRFYRADKARSMNHSYGLGLSIAQSYVKEHRGKIWAESLGGVNTFYVQLPL